MRTTSGRNLKMIIQSQSTEEKTLHKLRPKVMVQKSLTEVEEEYERNHKRKEVESTKTDRITGL